MLRKLPNERLRLTDSTNSVRPELVEGLPFSFEVKGRVSTGSARTGFALMQEARA